MGSVKIGSSADTEAEATLPADDAGRSEPEFPSVERGSTIGRYLVISRVGEGGMGVVFAAYDPQLDRRVALKLLRPRGRDLARARRRLQREAQALAKLDHPNVVAVHDVGIHAEQLFIAMEFVEGQTLGEWMATSPATSSGSVDAGRAAARVRPWREVLKVFGQAGRGLAAAHEAGLVHRDFKPDNVMLSEGGRVRVMDFGVARIDDEPTSDVTEHGAQVGSLTQTGAILGTPAYMSLEQFFGRTVDARSDQFSFCVALYEALYGERPFDGETIGSLVAARVEGVVRGPGRSGSVPGWVRAVVVRGLSSQPEKRFESMQALLDALAADPVARRRQLGLRLGLGLALGASGWGVIALSGQVEQRDAKIEEQADQLREKNVALEEQLAEQTRLLSVQRGLRARALVGTGSEAEALALGVQAVGAYEGAWERAPREAVAGLEQVLVHDTVIHDAGHVLQGHEGYVIQVAYSRDGTRLVTAGLDGRVRLWDPRDGQLRATFGEGGKIYGFAFSPDQTRLATASEDGRARIWEVESGTRLETLEGLSAGPSMVEFSPDGRRLAAAGFSRELRVWDVDTGALVPMADADAHRISALAHTPDGTRLVTADIDGRVLVRDAGTGQPQVTLAGHEGQIRAIAPSPDGARVATVSDDQTGRIWALETGESVAILEGHTRKVVNVAYSPDGQRVATVSWDGTGQVHDAETGARVARLVGGHRTGVPSLAYAPDGSRLATGSYGGTVAVWDAATGALQARLRGHRGDVWGLAFSPDGHQLATASVDHSARLWALGGDRVVTLEGPETDVRSFDYSPDRTKLVTVSTNGRLRLWNVETGALERVLDERCESEGLHWAPDGTRLMTVERGQLKIWDVRTDVAQSIPTVAAPTGIFSYSPAGTLLWGKLDGRLEIWDAHTLESLLVLEPPFREHMVSPDDSSLAGLTATSSVVLLDPRTGRTMAERSVPGSDIIHVKFSPDGEELASIDRDGTIRIWDAHRLASLRSLPTAPGTITMIYSPDGAQLAIASGVEGVRILDAQTGEIRLRLPPEDSDTRAGRVQYSADGSRLLVSGNGFVRVHDSASGKRLMALDRMSISHLALSPDGSQVTFKNAEHTIEVWDARTGERLNGERIGLRRDDGSVVSPISPRTLTRIGCERLRTFESHYPTARDVCDPLLGG